MNGEKAKAVRRQEERVREAGRVYGDDPTDENEEALDAAQAELDRLGVKGEPIVPEERRKAARQRVREAALAEGKPITDHHRFEALVKQQLEEE